MRLAGLVGVTDLDPMRGVDPFVRAEALLLALFHGHRGDGMPELERAIMTELLVMALDDPQDPETLADLYRVLHRWSHAGDAAAKLTEAVRACSSREPDTTLDELESRYPAVG